MRTFYLFLILLPVFMLSACSSSNVVTPTDTPVPADEQIAQNWGDYGLTFDPSTGDVDIEYKRESSIHYEISTFLKPPACGGSGCITATLNSWDVITHIASFDVTIENPSAWTPSDVRMIFYNLGIKEIANADSYTRAYVGTIEPFIAFGKSVLNRQFAAGTSITETVDIYWPPMSPFTLDFKVTAWLWLNCKDPYEINGMYQSGDLYPTGGFANVGCYVDDWQMNVTTVSVDATPINGGVNYMANPSGNHWYQGMTNSMGAPVGIYKCLITAVSPNPQNFDLYNYVDIEVIPTPVGWHPDGTWTLPMELCSLDLGVIADNPNGHILMAIDDAAGTCNTIVKFPGWGNPPAPYANLVNLDPYDLNFQPYPVVRLDAANDGAFGWTNANRAAWGRTFPIINKDTWCNFDNQPNFIWNPENDDHRHYMHWMQELFLEPVDTCDTFRGDQCALYVNVEQNLVGFQGIPGEKFGFDYTDMDMIWEAYFPPALVGADNGQIDPADIAGIDCWAEYEQSCIVLYVALKNNLRVEVFMICDVGPGPVDVVTHMFTMWVVDENHERVSPIDCELLPINPDYEPAFLNPVLCVLIDNAEFPYPPPGFGGSVYIYDALTGAFVDRIGDSTQPAVEMPPAFLDTDDTEYSIHITQYGPVVSKYDYY